MLKILRKREVLTSVIMYSVILMCFMYIHKPCDKTLKSTHAYDLVKGDVFWIWGYSQLLNYTSWNVLCISCNFCVRVLKETHRKDQDWLPLVKTFKRDILLVWMPVLWALDHLMLFFCMFCFVFNPLSTTNVKQKIMIMFSFWMCRPGAKYAVDSVLDTKSLNVSSYILVESTTVLLVTAESETKCFLLRWMPKRTEEQHSSDYGSEKVCCGGTFSPFVYSSCYSRSGIIIVIHTLVL